ncbi:uncharacterized protein PV09_00532 [Verruconis gallopava]|uniref:Uncharacterized protein n=1 Tax=Verruconis gallopava TaxID=253628 RepID=A0A0D1Z6K1_9PEZI|nr:uncharacterized protein PV09_00532 [Verruconis gallopava]KIW08567.1 hypothetical protein PV09_00532 [Verruconis gallopava]
MGLNYYASSPVLVMPHQQSNHFMHHPHDDSGASYNAMMVDPSPSRRFAPKLPTPPPSLNYLAQASHTTCRKRSRADIGDDIEAELETSAGPVQPPKPKVEPRYGPGMTLIYDEPSLNISPESQSGTWMEEKADIETASAAAALIDRPRLPARKLSRRVSVDENLESTSTSLGIDPIVLKLGIGWKRMSQDRAAAVAGDEAFIRNQYPYVQSPKILLHHEGLAIYVVRSDPIDHRGTTHQWWLFNEDLKSCRLLCNANEDDVLRRLANKRQDERGNWVPDILADGQVIYAKDAIKPLTTPQSTGPVEVMEVDA